MSKVYLGSKPVQGLYLGSKPVSLNGKPDTDKEMIEAIKNSLVCWYDIKRQGATNESMAANPILKDLSGNGHDATCYNFAWSGMSGVGGYGKLFKDFEAPIAAQAAIGELVNNYTIHITNVSSSKSAFSFAPNNKIKSKYKITGVSSEKSIKFGSDNPQDLVTLVTVTEDGVYDVDWSSEQMKTYYQCIIANFTGECNITIELLPEYPNAIVSDGVDDYAQVTGLPLLTKERGYTVIAKRDFVEMPNNTNSSVCTKRTETSKENGAFQFERFSNPTLGKVKVYNFGAGNIVDLHEELISYMTSSLYNGISINYATYDDSDTLVINSIRNNANYSPNKLVLYSLLLFDRDLTEQEIEWVKKNMIESGGC